MKKYLLVIVLFLTSFAVIGHGRLRPYIEVDETTYTPEQLVEDVFVNSPCITVTNIKSSTGTNFGQENGIGYFTDSSGKLGIDSGLILSTGSAVAAEGPHKSNSRNDVQNGGGYAWLGDKDLNDLFFNGDPNTFNTSAIEFDFVSKSNSISFDFIFASEEYGEYQCDYTDVFAFLLKDNVTGVTTNLGVIPGTTTVVSTLTVRDTNWNSDCPSENESYFGEYFNDVDSYGVGVPSPQNENPTNFRAYTIPIKAFANIVPNNSYTIKLVIADAYAVPFDSAVFIGASSFNLAVDLGDDITIANKRAKCQGDTVELNTNLPKGKHKWYKDTVEILGQKGSTLSVDEAGEYAVDVFFDEGCKSAGTSIKVEFIAPKTIQTVEDLLECNNTNSATVFFDLTKNSSNAIGSQNATNISITYHEDLTEAESKSVINPIAKPEAYAGTNNQEIYIRMATHDSCPDVRVFKLLHSNIALNAVSDIPLCEDAYNSGEAKFDLTERDNEVLGAAQSASDYVVKYYLNPTDADLGATNFIDKSKKFTNTKNPQPIYVRIENKLDPTCYIASKTGAFNLIVNPRPEVITPVTPLEACDGLRDGFELFNLRDKEAEILGTSQTPSDFIVEYFEKRSEIDTGTPIALPTAYRNSVRNLTQTIYAKVIEKKYMECYGYTSFDIIVKKLPVFKAPSPLSFCNDMITLDLAQKNKEILNGNTSNEVHYYNSQFDANVGDVARELKILDVKTLPKIKDVYVRVENKDTGCSSTTLLKLIDESPIVFKPKPLQGCAIGQDGYSEFDFTGVYDEVTGAIAGLKVSYHETIADVNSGKEITIPYTNTVKDRQTIYVRVENSFCSTYVEMDLIVSPKPTITIEKSYILCMNTNGTEVIGLPVIDTGLSESLYDFKWELVGAGDLRENTASIEVNTPGEYKVIVTDKTTGCDAMDTTQVVISESPNVNAEIKTLAFANTHVIEVTTTAIAASTVSVYEFSLDGGAWQTNVVNDGTYTFNDVSGGEHIVTIRDVNGCGESNFKIVVMDYPKYFTPNGDGYHDTWNIYGIGEQPDAVIYIYDRYGKLLKQLSPTGEGWDGRYKGIIMPTNDYWFSIEYREPSTLAPKIERGNFTLKR